jgi:uncharacterized membrane protein (UPF0127 family)
VKIIFILMAAFFGMVLPARAEDRHYSIDSMKEDPLKREDITIRGPGKKALAHTFHVELALGPLDQLRGLMERTSLPADEGMLFVFPDEQPRSFWMKDTLIPLDMIFIRQDGTIGHIHANAAPNDMTSIPSQGPAMAVLELNGGTAAKLGIKPGDKVYDKDYFKNAPAP